MGSLTDLNVWERLVVAHRDAVLTELTWFRDKYHAAEEARAAAEMARQVHTHSTHTAHTHTHTHTDSTHIHTCTHKHA